MILPKMTIIYQYSTVTNKRKGLDIIKEQYFQFWAMKFCDLKTPKPFPTKLSTQWDKSDHCAHSTEKKTYPALHFVNLTLISCLQPPTLCLEGTNLPQKIATDLSPT